MLPSMSKVSFGEIKHCEGRRGQNTCGRTTEFEIVSLEGDVYDSCVECVGRIIYEHDLDRAEVFRIWNQ